MAPWRVEHQGPEAVRGMAGVESLNALAPQQSLETVTTETMRQQLVDLMEERRIWKAQEGHLRQSLEEAEKQAQGLYDSAEAMAQWLHLRACALGLVSQGLVLGEGMLQRGVALF